MKTVRPNLLLAVVGVALASFAPVTQATLIIWSEDFSNVSDWQVIFQTNYPAGTSVAGASISSSGGLGLFGVASNTSEAAFGPIPSGPGAAPLVAFDITKTNDYAMDFTVDSLTGSTSYDIRLDQFDANTNYLSTILNVFPQGTFAGSTNVALGAFSYNASTVFLLPKITVFTGLGNQTVRFDSMDFTLAVPEPSTALLFVFGLGIIWRKRIKTLLPF